MSDREWEDPWPGYAPDGAQVGHGLGVVLKVGLLAVGDGRGIVEVGEDVFLAPGRVDGRVLVVVARLGAGELPWALRRGLLVRDAALVVPLGGHGPVAVPLHFMLRPGSLAPLHGGGGGGGVWCRRGVVVVVVGGCPSWKKMQQRYSVPICKVSKLSGTREICFSAKCGHVLSFLAATPQNVLRTPVHVDGYYAQHRTASTILKLTVLFLADLFVGDYAPVHEKYGESRTSGESG